jgi:hypothetical protein
MQQQSKFNFVVGLAAMVLSILMWLTLADQIRLNLAGNKGSVLLAQAILTNCILWVTYGASHEPREWKVALANAPGVILGLINLITIAW